MEAESVAGSVVSTVMGSIARFNATVRNGLEVALLGGLGPTAEASPFEVAVERPVYRLRRYFPGTVGAGPARRGG